METIPTQLATDLKTGGVTFSVYADVYQGGVKKATLDLVAGSVSQSWSAPVRRTVSFSIAGWDGIAPDTDITGTTRKYGEYNFGSMRYGDEVRTYLRGLLLPLVTKVDIYQRCVYTTGTHDVHLGRFTLDDPTFKDQADGSFTIDCTGWDRAGDYQQDRIHKKIKLVANLNSACDQLITYLDTYVTAADDPVIVEESHPDSTGLETTAQGTYLPGCGKSAWSILRELAETVKVNAYINRNGAIDMQAIPENAYYPSPVYTFNEDNLLNLTMVPSAREFCNQVIVTGENAKNAPVVATATDTTSPYRQAVLGRYIVREFKVDGVATHGQAQNVANSKLRKYGRLVETVAGTCLPIPHLEVGDAVRIQDAQLELDATFILESVEYPLDPTSPATFTASRGV